MSLLRTQGKYICEIIIPDVASELLTLYNEMRYYDLTADHVIMSIQLDESDARGDFERVVMQY